MTKDATDIESDMPSRLGSENAPGIFLMKRSARLSKAEPRSRVALRSREQGAGAAEALAKKAEEALRIWCGGRNVTKSAVKKPEDGLIKGNLAQP